MLRTTLRPGRLLALAIPAALALAVAVATLTPAPAAPVEVDPVVLDAQKKRIETIKKVQPAVVAVLNADGSNGGSGVIIDPDGYALTNFHVVAATGAFPKCGLADGKLYDGVIVGIDKVGDVALIKLHPKEKGKPFPYVKLGDSDKVRPGDWSLAMGNPFLLATDFTPTVTYGVVSGTYRYQPPEGKGLLEYTDCIQIETSINPGNSGGPLFNMDGELIGINGRGSFEKRGRVNSGVGYAISINQIKNFMGHLYAGIDADHATLGADVRTLNDDLPISPMVVRDILDESDAFRRGLKVGDQLLSFGLVTGRPITSTNVYKNILGIYPKEWRVPVGIRRENERKEILVRLMGHQANVIEKPPMPGGPPMPAPPPPPKADPARMYEARKGYSNWYFNTLERDKLLTAFKTATGDFAPVGGTWVIEGEYKMVDRNGPLKVEIAEDKDGSTVKLKMNIDTALQPLRQTDLRLLKEPINSGGLLMAFYQYHRFLTVGAKGFEGLSAHGGNEPWYPYPLDGSQPKSLAALRVDCAVIVTKHGTTVCKWYFSLKDKVLIGFESYISKDAKNAEDPNEADPCEVYFHDYKDVGGRKLPHTIEVRYADKRYAVLTVNKYTLAATPK